MDIEKYRKKIEVAINQKEGEFGNGILYKMCKENPKHDKPDVVSGKVWLIGRAYSTAIERVRSKKNINDDFYKEKVGPKLTDIELDKRLGRLQSIKKMTKDNTTDILSLHKYLQDRIQEITGMGKRSLCSKYLHFHLPRLFFIYDSRAAKTLQKIYPNRLKGFDIIVNDDVDKAYAIFFCKALTLKNEVEEKLGLELTPRQIDTFLVNEANKLLRKKE
jgi:hypothetical protein